MGREILPIQWTSSRPDLPRPVLADGFVVPQRGATRTAALEAGLAPRWRIVAAHDESGRAGDVNTPDDFVTYLISNGAVWVIATVYNQDWEWAPDRHALLVGALSGAMVGTSPSDLVQRLMGSRVWPTNPKSGRRHWGYEGCLDALDLILSADYPGRETDAFLCALSEHQPPLQARRAALALLNATRDAVQRYSVRRLAAGKDQRSPTGKDYALGETLIRRCVESHWNAATQSLSNTHPVAERAVMEDFFGVAPLNPSHG